MMRDLALWGLATPLSVVVAEIALRLPFAVVVAKLMRTMDKAVRVLRARGVSDHWKEKAMRAYAGTTFVGSLRLAALLACLVAVALAGAVAGDAIVAGFSDFLIDWPGVTFTLLIATVYLVLRRVVVHGRLRHARSAAAPARLAGAADRRAEL